MSKLYNLEIEKTILSCLMLEDNMNTMKSIIREIKDNYFYNGFHRNIYNFISNRIIERINPDSLIVSDEFPDKLELIMEIQGKVATSANIFYSIGKLKDLYVKREFILKSSRLTESIIDSIDPLKDISEYMLDLKNFKSNSKYKIITPREVAKKVLNQMKNADLGNDLFIPFKTSFVDLQLKLMRKQLHFLGGCPGSGKTSFILNIFSNQMQNNIPGIFFCGESSTEEIFIKLVSIISGVAFNKIISGIKFLSKNEIQNIKKAFNILEKHDNLYYLFGKGDYEHSKDGMDFILNTVSESKKLAIIYVDHLQNMKPFKHLLNAPSSTQIEENARGLNELLATYNLAGVALSQLNRSSYIGGKPEFRHLKGSSAIEEEADSVSMLYSENDDYDIKGLKTVEWYSLKTRNDSKFSIKLDFRGQNTCFVGVHGFDYNFPSHWTKPKYK